MLPNEVISGSLEAQSKRRLGQTRSRELGTLKGVRGVPDGELARICADVWKQGRPTLPNDEDALSALFSTAWDDGIVAVGLLAALVPDHPAECFEIGLEWLTRADDTGTADALGWTVLGPSIVAAQLPIVHLLRPLARQPHAAPRRAAVMAGMAFTGCQAEGPAAAALRQRLGVKQISWVEHAIDEHLCDLSDAFLRDEDPTIRKALRRVMREWAKTSPQGLVDWYDTVRGGVPKILKAEIDKARRRAQRQEES